MPSQLVADHREDSREPSYHILRAYAIHFHYGDVHNRLEYLQS